MKPPKTVYKVPGRSSAPDPDQCSGSSGNTQPVLCRQQDRRADSFLLFQPSLRCERSQYLQPGRYSLGGMLNIQTAPFLGGFGVGVSFYTANALGANNLSGAPAYPHLDTTLMGPQQSVNALGQAYLQYAIPKRLLIRAGDQVINTPWLNNSDSRLLPATYEGVYAEYSPFHEVKLYGLREFRWKSRTSGNYYKDNLYYPATFSGDTLYGGTTALSASAPQTSGTLAFGVSTQVMGLKAQAWYYDFYQFANTFYSDANYTLKTGTGLDPFIAAQFMRQWSNNSLLDGTRLNNSPVSATSVSNTSWGVQAGLNYTRLNSIIGGGQLAWSYNEILPPRRGGGRRCHRFALYRRLCHRPPLYHLHDPWPRRTGTGNAWKVKWTQNLFDKQVLLMAAFARYHTYFQGASNDTYLDLTYFFPGKLKGLSIRDRVEVSNGQGA